MSVFIISVCTWIQSVFLIKHFVMSLEMFYFVSYQLTTIVEKTRRTILLVFLKKKKGYFFIYFLKVTSLIGDHIFLYAF